MSPALRTAAGAKGSCKFGSLLCHHLNSCLGARLEGSVRALCGPLDLTYRVHSRGNKENVLFPLKRHYASARANHGEKQTGKQGGWLHPRDEPSRAKMFCGTFVDRAAVH